MKSDRMWCLLDGQQRILHISDRRSSCISWAEKAHGQKPWRKLRGQYDYSVVRCTVTYGAA
jgi:hypothetical protein